MRSRVRGVCVGTVMTSSFPLSWHAGAPGVTPPPFPARGQRDTLKTVPWPAPRMTPAMRWLNLEYVLKGIYLGLLVYVALQAPGWPALGVVALCLLGGLALSL